MASMDSAGRPELAARGVDGPDPAGRSGSDGAPNALPSAGGPLSGTEAGAPDTLGLEPPTTAPAPLEGAEVHRRFVFGLERLVFFSDAVMAIAITLLVIDVRLPPIRPPVTDAALAAGVRELAPQLFAFTLSFVVIAAFWLGHFRTFRWVARLDGRLIALDFLFLFIVALLPFPTSLEASYGDRPLAAVIYAGTVTAGGLAAAALWIYPMRIAGLGVAAITPEIGRRVTWRTLVIPAVFGLSIPLALVSPLAADALWILALPAQMIVSRRLSLSLTLG